MNLNFLHLTEGKFLTTDQSYPQKLNDFIPPFILFLWTAGCKDVSCSERVSWHRDVCQQWTLSLPLCFLLRSVAGLDSNTGWVEICSASSDKSATNSFSPFIQATQSNVCILKMINLSIRTKTGRYLFSNHVGLLNRVPEAKSFV